jgi:hypothetical protein
MSNNGSKPQPQAAPQPDYKAEAQFWQIKYFELLGHSNQIIAMLSRPFMQDQMTAQLAQIAAMQAGATSEQANSGAAGVNANG